MSLTDEEQLRRDAMRSPDDLDVYADVLEGVGSPLRFDYRYVALILRQAQELLPRLKFRPTGSRFYGTYWTMQSDWDYYTYCHDTVYSIDKLTLNGWRSSQNRPSSLYKGNVNLILLSEPDYSQFDQATTQAVIANPSTKEEALNIFREIMETDEPMSWEPEPDDILGVIEQEMTEFFLRSAGGPRAV